MSILSISISICLSLHHLGESFSSLRLQYRIGTSTVAGIIFETCTALYEAMKDTYLKVGSVYHTFFTACVQMILHYVGTQESNRPENCLLIRSFYICFLSLDTNNRGRVACHLSGLPVSMAISTLPGRLGRKTHKHPTTGKQWQCVLQLQGWFLCGFDGPRRFQL